LKQGVKIQPNPEYFPEKEAISQHPVDKLEMDEPTVARLQNIIRVEPRKENPSTIFRVNLPSKRGDKKKQAIRFNSLHFVSNNAIYIQRKFTSPGGAIQICINPFCI